MASERVIDPVGRGIGLIDADGEGGVGLKPADQEIGQAAVVIEQDADLPGAGLAEIDRGEGMDGDDRVQSAGTGRPSLSVTIRLLASGARLQSMIRREVSGQKSGASSLADRILATESAPRSHAMCVCSASSAKPKD